MRTGPHRHRAGRIRADLGLVLPHEHLHNDASVAYSESDDATVARILAGPVRAEDAWLLHDNPYRSLDNCGVDDAVAVLDDLSVFAANGGRTVVDLTPPGIGRRPDILAEYSRKSGVRVVMGSGWYLESTHPAEVDTLGIDSLAASLIDEFTSDNEIAPGVIGEIGVSPSFTDNEAKALRAACVAQREVKVPLFVHLPGWERYGHRVLDIVVNEMGVDPSAVALCHMDPSGNDPDYQRSVADRGVYLEFDMIGMPFEFPEGQSPHPAETALAVTGLVSGGYHERLLLSHDVFLKSMLRRHGGNGFAYVPVSFAARLVRSGVDPQLVSTLMRDNPRSLFEGAGNGQKKRHGRAHHRSVRRVDQLGCRRMRRSSNLLERQQSNLAAARAVRFIEASTDGTLSDSEFRRYLVIEEAFVLTAVRVLGLVVAESKSLDDALDHVISMSNLVAEQRDYFAELRSRFPYAGDVEALVEESSALSKFALALARTSGRSAALVGMFAAESLYLSWCRLALEVDADREPALQHWIEMHTQPKFVAQVQALAREVDAMPDSVTDADLDSWFAGMLSAEIEFHDVAAQ